VEAFADEQPSVGQHVLGRYLQRELSIGDEAAAATSASWSGRQRESAGSESLSSLFASATEIRVIAVGTAVAGGPPRRSQRAR